MAYGFETKEDAESLMAKLRAQEPENKFVVAPHSWLPGFPTRLNGPKQKSVMGYEEFLVNEEAARTWGVVRYTPYCEQMPWRCAGFVWF